MSIIKQPLLFVGSKGEKHLYALYDSGANLSCINPAFVEELETPIHLGRTRLISTAAEGHYIEITHRVSLDFYIDKLGFKLTNQWVPHGKIEWCWLQRDEVSIMLQEPRDRDKWAGDPILGRVYLETSEARNVR